MQINCYISLPSLVKVVCFLYTLVFSVVAIPAACNSASKEGHAVHTEMKICVLVSATSRAAYWLLVTCSSLVSKCFCICFQLLSQGDSRPETQRHQQRVGSCGSHTQHLPRAELLHQDGSWH